MKPSQPGEPVRSSAVLALSILLPALVCCPACQSGSKKFVADQAETPPSSAIDLVSFEPPHVPTPASQPIEVEFDAPPVALSDIEDLEHLPPERTLGIDLDFVVQEALRNTAVVRDSHQFLSAGNTLLRSPEQVASALDPEIYASSAMGVTAALAAFDAQLATGAQWGENALVQTNNFYTGNVAPTNVLVSESGSLYGRLDQGIGTGGLVSLVHNWNYTPENLPSRDFNSRYVGFLRGEVRQPLLAGRGAAFTDVAGPASVTGGQLGRGVLVASLDQNISVIDFSLELQQLVKQSHYAYWELWLAHHTHRRLAASRDHARELLERVRNRTRTGLAGGNAVNEAQAEEAMLQRESAVNDALAEAFDRENRLRRLIGHPTGGGQLLIPTQAPFEGQAILDWDSSVRCALENRVELQQQQLRLESLQAQFVAAESLVQPQLDLVAGAQVNGFGDELFNGGSGGSSAYNTLLDGDQAGWNVGLELSVPLGRTASRAQLRNLRQRVSKARQVLDAQQQEIRHELVHAHREVERAYRSLELAQRRSQAAERRRLASEADFEAGRSSVDPVLRAQAAQADAEIALLGSMANYSKALIDVRYREGVLLAEHEIVVDPSACR